MENHAFHAEINVVADCIAKGFILTCMDIEFSHNFPIQCAPEQPPEFT